MTRQISWFVTIKRRYNRRHWQAGIFQESAACDERHLLGPDRARDSRVAVRG
jgi:hypothetical protein